MDRALGLLARQVAADPSTLLIAMADHRGGGAMPNDHESEHPVDTTIPIVLARGALCGAFVGVGAPDAEAAIA